MTKPVEEENTASVLELLAQQVSLPVLLIMVEQAGLSRSRPSIMADAAAGRLKMVRIGEKFWFTTRAEALRYIGWLTEMEQHKVARSGPSQTALAGFEKLSRDFAA